MKDDDRVIGDESADDERGAHPMGASILLVSGVTLLIILLSLASAWR